jgi:hypothetical protein
VLDHTGSLIPNLNGTPYILKREGERETKHERGIELDKGDMKLHENAARVFVGLREKVRSVS